MLIDRWCSRIPERFLWWGLTSFDCWDLYLTETRLKSWPKRVNSKRKFELNRRIRNASWNKRNYAEPNSWRRRRFLANNNKQAQDGHDADRCEPSSHYNFTPHVRQFQHYLHIILGLDRISHLKVIKTASYGITRFYHITRKCSLTN